MCQTITKIVAVLIVFVTSVVARLLPAQALAVILDCDYYGQNYINGNTFLNYERADYQHGLLSFHFTLNPQSSERVINTTFRFQEVDTCHNLDEPITTTGVHLPQDVNNFSIRFIASNTYQFYDDDTGTPVECAGCNLSFPGSSLTPGPYRVQFDLFTSNLDSSFSSTSQFIQDQGSAPARTPVLIVPGITGTELYKGTNHLWIDLSRATSTDGDAFLDPLAFNTNLTPLDTSLTIGNVIKKLNDPVVGQFTVFDYTESLVRQLEDEGYTENVDLFTFPYDWRFSVEHSASLLRNKMQHILDQTRALKVDVIAHSTGGLIAKKYVMDNLDPKVGKLVFVGTPNLGAPKAAKVLLAGDSLGIPLLADSEVKKIAQNMPAIYDLAPSAGYFNIAGSYLSVSTRNNFLATTTKNLDYNQTKSYLFNNKGLNSLAIAQAERLHSPGFDNYDVRAKGVDAYNIVGCKAGTIGRITERLSTPTTPFYNGYTLSYTPGDGTVPLFSADTIPTDPSKLFFAFDVQHGDMLSHDSTRQQIVKIISGNASINPGGNIRSDNSHCKLNGRTISIFSPVNIEVTDQAGRRAGLLPDGSINNDIPNAQFDIVDDHKFVYLPTDEDQQYTINLTGTGTGTFTVEAGTISDNRTTKTSFYYNLPVTATSRGQLQLNGDTTLKFDNVMHQPDAVLTPKQLHNLDKKKLFFRWVMDRLGRGR